MLYSEIITFPFGQTENTRTTRRFRMNRGILFRVWIQFPPGCAGLTKVRVLHQGHPIIPTHKEDSIRADNYTFELPLMYEIRGAPEQMVIEGWNEDDTYNHTIMFMFLTLPKWVAFPHFILSKAIESLTKLFI